MKLIHFGTFTVFLAGTLLVNLRYPIPAVLTYGFIVILGATAVAWYWIHADPLTRDQSKSGRTRLRTSLSPQDAPERVNRYLRETPGRRPIDYTNRRKLHDDTKEVKLDGEKKKAYAVIGKEQDLKNDKDVETVRVIWNLTDDEFVTYDGWVPGKHRTDPWFNKDEWQHREGYRADQNEQSTRGNQVFVNTGPPNHDGDA
ncbi:hypothetical protein [Natrinema salinisoli]|uniref:hypothetical protein n=1 Tax=Natrinema salinisoli TaxID=2878535 RepID=UPI001CF08680|nr:hypothetical protein [Natrinema salinisoli]